VSELGCGDHFCYITGKRKGMGTNGGCKCVSSLIRGGGTMNRIALERVLEGLHSTIESQTKTIVKLEKIAEAVAHTGIDFGYGPYIVEEKYVKAASDYLESKGAEAMQTVR